MAVLWEPQFRSEVGVSAVAELGKCKRSSLSSLSRSFHSPSRPRPPLFPIPLSKKLTSTAVPQDHNHQEEARARREAEPADPAVDPLPHGQQDPVQRQAPPLEAHKARVLEKKREKRREEREKERGEKRFVLSPLLLCPLFHSSFCALSFEECVTFHPH